jgi:hypothetical protein
VQRRRTRRTRSSSSSSWDAEHLAAMARETAEPQQMAQGFPGAAQLLLARGNRERAQALLRELERTSGIRADIFYAALLPGLVRCALALLAECVEPRTPLVEHTLSACRAQLTEGAGASSGTSPSTPTPSSARAAACSPSETPPPNSHSARRRSCSARWATTPRSWKPRRC